MKETFKFKVGDRVSSLKSNFKGCKIIDRSAKKNDIAYLLDNQLWVSEQEIYFDPTMTYDEVMDKTNELVKNHPPLMGHHVNYSSYNFADDSDDYDKLDLPKDFVLHDKPVAFGRYKIALDRLTLPFVEIYNPTFANIMQVFNAYNNGHHIFYEGMEIDDVNKVIKISTGS
jgi:hypothetical protein